MCYFPSDTAAEYHSIILSVWHSVAMNIQIIRIFEYFWSIDAIYIHIDKTQLKLKAKAKSKAKALAEVVYIITRCPVPCRAMPVPVPVPQKVSTASINSPISTKFSG